MNNYFRIAGYYPDKDLSFIIDSNGMFEKLWQFSSFLISKGLKVIEVSKQEDILDVNIKPIEEENNHIFLRAYQKGELKYIEHKVDGTPYKAVQVGNKIYIPNK